MKGNAAPRLFAGLLLFAVAFLVGACGHKRDDSDINTFPANYKADIIAAMHAYLNDPTGIRDTGLSEPVLKPVERTMRYVACLRFNGKRNATEYAGVKQVAAVFLAGRFDHFVEQSRESRELCDNATYAPFPELEKLPR
jgi:hypothetical protein